jgi:radical SAM superfamily enzyme YgiQ (UPF0313 family)
MDVLICNFPPRPTWYLPAAPAILIGACNWLDLESDFIDLNILDFKSGCNIVEWASIINQKNPKLLALSIFSYKSRQFAIDLGKELKKINPTIKIVAGGSGIKDSINGPLMQSDIIDYYIVGDGEAQWPEFLIKYFNIQRDIKIVGLDIPYAPDYSHYNVDFYQQQASLNNITPYVPITGSRGCVRRCTFCEVPDRWDFIQRSPAHIAIEVVKILEMLPNAHIHFTDSLVNGSLPAFNKLLDHLITIRQQYPSFTWGGQFIIRSLKQSGEEYWKKIAESGAQKLEIGIETGSDRLRIEMKKNFYNVDLDHSLKFMDKFNISCMFLLFVGYPTETLTDISDTALMFEKYAPLANKIIKAVTLGSNMGIAPGTPIYNQSKKNTDMILTKDVTIWFNKKNPTLTYIERMTRRKQLEDKLIELGYQLVFDNHQLLLDSNRVYTDNINLINLIEKQR